MTKVGIVTDSVNCLPSELIKEYNINVVPYILVLEGKEYQDQIDITPTEFWQRFSILEKLPTTGANGPGEYANVFSELSKSTDSIVCISVSKEISAGYASAENGMKKAIEEHPKIHIELIDSRNAAGAQGFIALEAARAAQAGKSLAEVVRIARDLIPKVKFAFALDTLKYLIKGGRAPKTAYVGELLQIKPIISIDSVTGVVGALGKGRGKKKVMLKMVDLIKNYADIKKPLHVNVHYTNRIEDGEELRELITSRYDCVEVYLTDLTPVMTAHTGPAVGLSFYSE